MALNEDDQMQAVFISTRTPVEVDPVSGNEVPPGSLPEEVRDDIPAQLSEGEYVVPADVLRFYGMKFFEDLRKNAKIELAQMEAEGRIGGEPIEPMQQDDLTPEEMAEIEKMTMAVGGYATGQPTQSTQPDPYQQQQMMYRQGAPVAMGNAGYQEGGGVAAPPPPETPLPPGTQAQLDFSQFGAGFSFSPQAQDNLEQIGQAAFPEPEFTPVTMYGPNNGKPVVEAKTLEQYNKLLAEGYTTTPPVIDNNDPPDPPEEEEPKDPTAWADGLDFTNGEQIQAAVDSYLGVTDKNKKVAGLGLLGAAFVGVDRITGVARSHAIANVLEASGSEEGLALAEKIRKQIAGVEDGMLFKLVPDDFHNGSQITQQLIDKYGSLEGLIVKNAASKSKEKYQSMTSIGTSQQAMQDEETVMSQTADPSSGGSGSLVTGGPTSTDPAGTTYGEGESTMEQEIDKEVEDYEESGVEFDMNDPSTWNTD